MAREISTSYPGAGANLYVVIRRPSADGYVWSVTNSAWEVRSDVNLLLGQYSVSLTDQGGDLYTGDFPTAIAAGDYELFFYERAGASPATDDLLLKSPVQHWDGDALTTTSSVSISPYALTTLASVKRRLEIDDSSSDTILSELINQVSALIERVTGRNFKARDYRKWLNGNRQRELRLPQYPVQGSPRIAFGSANAMSLTYTGSGIRANAGVYRDPETADAGGLRLISYNTSGVKTSTDLPFTTYGSVSALVTAANLISGWSATTLINQPSLDLHPSGSEDAKGRTVTLTYPDLNDYTFSVNYDNGTIQFNAYSGGASPYWSHYHVHPRMPRAFQYILAEWRGGFETIPADVNLLCNEIVADKYFEGQFGRGITEVRLGPGLLKLDQSEIDDIREQLKGYIDQSSLIGEA
jgi:hypothetical protein